MQDWRIYRKTSDPHEGISQLPDAPPWRTFSGSVPDMIANKPVWNSLDEAGSKRGSTYRASDDEIDAVNAAMYLRRPLLITGSPGTGKSSLAYSVAWQLKLGPVLRWSITSRSTLRDGLYQYDALGRLQDANLDPKSGKDPASAGRYIRLGPLGTALYPTNRARLLLIDEIDKCDVDLPNDLLHVFEEGEFEIPELARLPSELSVVNVMPHGGRLNEDKVPITGGRVACREFPIVILTSNGERDFPPAFLRRCLRVELQQPDKVKMSEIVKAHLNLSGTAPVTDLLNQYMHSLERGEKLATDQLLNSIFLLAGKVPMPKEEQDKIRQILLRELE